MSVVTDIEDLRVLARKRVPRMFYDYTDSGSWTESTYRSNEEAGVRSALDIIARELDTTMALCGQTDIRDIDRSVLMAGTCPS